jgi:hypothetical protein
LNKTRLHKFILSAKWPPRTAPIAEHPGAQLKEGGQVEPVLGAFLLFNELIGFGD